MGTTSRFSISRDTLIRHAFEDNFFVKVPELIAFKEMFANCKETYKKELEQKGCTCRMTTEWAKPCVLPMMEQVEAAKKTNHALVRNFIRCIGRYSEDADVDHVGVSIIYDKTYDIFVDTAAPEEKAD
jgi:hypothetical protein